MRGACYFPGRVTASPHDALFKAAFERPERAAELLRSKLSPDLVAAIDWSSLVSEPGSFISPELEGRHSDLLFSARLAQHAQARSFFYLLLEHQSSNDPDMPLRVLVYMTRIWERFRKDQPGVSLPAIVPLVISHAPGGWTSPTRLGALFAPEVLELEELTLYRPDFEFLLDDLSRFNDADIRSRVTSAFAQLAMWLFRDARTAETLLANLPAWGASFSAALGADSGSEALHQLLRYIALVSEDVQFDSFRAKLVELAPEAEDPSMTIAEQLRAEGEAKGLVKGRAEGMRRTLRKQLELKFGRVDDATVSRIDAADEATLDGFLERVLTADSLDAVLGS